MYRKISFIIHQAKVSRFNRLEAMRKTVNYLPFQICKKIDQFFSSIFSIGFLGDCSHLWCHWQRWVFVGSSKIGWRTVTQHEQHKFAQEFVDMDEKYAEIPTCNFHQWFEEKIFEDVEKCHSCLPQGLVLIKTRRLQAVIAQYRGCSK